MRSQFVRGCDLRSQLMIKLAAMEKEEDKMVDTQAMGDVEKMVELLTSPYD